MKKDCDRNWRSNEQIFSLGLSTASFGGEFVSVGRQHATVESHRVAVIQFQRTQQNYYSSIPDQLAVSESLKSKVTGKNKFSNNKQESKRKGITQAT